MNLEQWVRDNYDTDQINDIMEHGCSAGVNGLIYYAETAEVYQKFQAEIWEVVCDVAEGMGEAPLQLIAGFNGAKEVYDDAQFKNLLVWFAVEEAARNLRGVE